MEYIPPASVADVAFEQLADLLEHFDGCDAKPCRTCRRLSLVIEKLLVPFEC